MAQRSKTRWLERGAVVVALIGLAVVGRGLSRSRAELRQRESVLESLREDVELGHYLERRLGDLTLKCQQLSARFEELDVILPRGDRPSLEGQLARLEKRSQRRTIGMARPDVYQWRSARREQLRRDIEAGSRDELEWMASRLRFFGLSPLSLALSTKTVVGRVELDFELSARCSLSGVARALGRMSDLPRIVDVESMRLRRDPSFPNQEDAGLITLTLRTYGAPKVCPVTHEASAVGDEPRGLHSWRDGNGMLTSSEHRRAGSLHGTRRTWHANGMPRMVEHYKKGKLQGVSSLWRNDGSLLYRMGFEEGHADGSQEVFWSNGAKHWQRRFLHGDSEGTFVSWYDSGCVAELHRKGVDPLQLTLSESGKEMEQRIVEPGGVLISRSGEDGRRVLEWHLDDDDEPRASWKWWYPSGPLARHAEFGDEGRLDRVREWSEAGELELDCSGCPYLWNEGRIDGSLLRGYYEGGAREGTWTEWSADGTMLARSEYQHGRLHGTRTRWHRTGRLAWVQEFREGQQEGHEIRYSGTGEVWEETFTYERSASVEDEQSAGHPTWSFPQLWNPLLPRLARH